MVLEMGCWVEVKGGVGCVGGVELQAGTGVELRLEWGGCELRVVLEVVGCWEKGAVLELAC